MFKQYKPFDKLWRYTNLLELTICLSTDVVTFSWTKQHKASHTWTTDTGQIIVLADTAWIFVVRRNRGHSNSVRIGSPLGSVCSSSSCTKQKSNPRSVTAQQASKIPYDIYIFTEVKTISKLMKFTYL